ncbi:hypothetical protein JCM10213_007837 [Rhodosporidiobolus nylandii]
MSQPAVTAAASRDGGEGEGEREDAGEVRAVSPFERLPDELLLAILEQVHLKTPLLKRNRLAALAANKRIYRLAQLVAFRAVGPSSPEKQAVILSGLFARHRLHPFVRSLAYEYSPVHVTYDTSLIPLFAHLSTLTLTLKPTVLGEPLAVPAAFTAMLKRLTRLTRLSFARGPWFNFEDKAFHLGQDLPTVRTLEFEDGYPDDDSVLQLLASGTSIEHLSFSFEGNELGQQFYSHLPWASLKSLKLEVLEDMLLPRREALLSSLRSVIFPTVAGDPIKLPLTSLCLGGWPLGLKDAHEPTGLGSESLTELFRLLVHSQLKDLRLFYPDQPLLNIKRDVTLPSVFSLTLSGEHGGSLDPVDLPALPYLLRVFPHLQQLVLDELLVDGYVSKRQPAHKLSRAFLPLHYPSMAALIAFASTTQLLQVDWTQSGQKVTLRWTRASPADEFKLERYRR